MLVKKIKDYLKDHSIQELYNRTGVSPTVIYKLLKRDWWRYNKTKLDILYDFFKLEKDDFYKDNLRKRYRKTESLFWTFIRYKRLKLNKHLDELAEKIMMEKRALARLEAGDSLPWFKSWTIQHLFEELKFTEQEKELTKQFIEVIKKLEQRVKELEKDIE